MDRVNLGIKYSNRFSIVWGIGVFIILAVLGRKIASLFSSDEVVISTIAAYLRIVPLGYALQGVFVISTSTLNVLHKPFHAAGLTIMQMFVLYIPLALLGNYLFGLVGIFFALALSYSVSGIAAYLVLGKGANKLIKSTR